MARRTEPLLPRHVPRSLRLLLVALVFAVFFTGTKLIPGLRNNFGPFEIVGSAVILLFLIQYQRDGRAVRNHPMLHLLAAMVLAAAVSLVQLPAERLRLGVVQTLILAFMYLLVLALYNLMIRYQLSPVYLLKLVARATLVIGPWVLLAGAGGGDIQEAGPFRNRAHMANYMLTAFWLGLLYSLWPGIARRERLIAYGAMAAALYPIAASGRRSVYLSMILGLAAISLSLLLAAGRRRRQVVAAIAVVLVVVGLFVTVGGRWLPQLAFFQERIAGIGDRLEMAARTTEEADAESNFLLLQRRGALQAFRDRPLLGIGWGGFYNSPYSPTGHELHSTPLRFLAELGIVGVALYLGLMLYLLMGPLYSFLLLRRGPYAMPALAMLVALWSLAASYAYNRHITERTFWLLVVVVLTFEALARSLARQSARLAPRQVDLGAPPPMGPRLPVRPRGPLLPVGAGGGRPLGAGPTGRAAIAGPRAWKSR